MISYRKVPAMLVATGMAWTGLPQYAQAPDINDLSQQIQKLNEQVHQLQDQQRAAEAAKVKPSTPQSPFTQTIGGATITFYGCIDEYFNHMTSTSGSTINAFEDGGILRSRYGLKGEKPVADGYAMKFTLEGGFNVNNGQGADLAGASGNGVYGGRIFDRQAWVGLSTPIGEFRVGRQNTAVFFRGSDIDFGERTIGGIINLFGVPSRYDSDFSYISKRLYGLRFEGHYSIAGSNTDGYTNQHVYQLALDYVNGPFVAGYANVIGAPPTGTPYATTVVYHNLYANYKYGKGRIYVAGIRSNNNGPSGALFNGGSPLSNVGATGSGTLVTGTNSAVNTYYNIWQVSADYFITEQLKIGALYGVIHNTAASDADAKGGAVGVWWDAFKDTRFYGYYDVIQNDSNAGFRQAASAGLPNNFTAASDVNGQRIGGFQVGVRYLF